MSVGENAEVCDGASVIANWPTAHNRVHDIALLKGPDSKLHHFAFQMKDWNAILHVAYLLRLTQDLALSHWAGVIPVMTAYGDPLQPPSARQASVE